MGPLGETSGIQEGEEKKRPQNESNRESSFSRVRFNLLIRDDCEAANFS
jgi:hypothetical protein